ncbi:MAG: hypothetical protein WBB85_04645, partial [Albidovulum sp.]|uniref:hypothetical protein n=1 Tax=Albidovulum sp. TaxID=1872424 RepID=UPI003C95654A
MLRRRGNKSFGEGPADIRSELERYSDLNGYPATLFGQCRYPCGHSRFRLRVDEAEGYMERVCQNCSAAHAIGDSARFAEDAVPEECACPCGGEDFAITIGLALYSDSSDIRWVYAGC